jgi:hypothetical protein
MMRLKVTTMMIRYMEEMEMIYCLAAEVVIL